MKRSACYWLLLLLWVSCSGPKPIIEATYEPALLGDLSQAESNRVWRVSKAFPDGTEIAIAMVDGDKIRFAGLRRVQGTLQAVENETAVFEIGSITKVFTAHLLQKLILAGDIESGETLIQPALGWPIKGDPPITYQQLANHTSGLPPVPANYKPNIFSYNKPYAKYDSLDLRKGLGEILEMSYTPGEEYQYSNFGMGLLGFSLGKVAGQSYAELLQTQIFDSLGMTHSYATLDQMQGTTVRGQNNRGQKTSYWEFKALAGAGGALSTVSDLGHYAQWSFEALIGDFAPLARRSFAIDARMDIALGWHIDKTRNPKPFLWHNGGTGGFKSCMALDRPRRKAVIVLSNISAVNNPLKQKIDILCFDLLGSMQE